MWHQKKEVDSLSAKDRRFDAPSSSLPLSEQPQAWAST